MIAMSYCHVLLGLATVTAYRHTAVTSPVPRSRPHHRGPPSWAFIISHLHLFWATHYASNNHRHVKSQNSRTSFIANARAADSHQTNMADNLVAKLNTASPIWAHFGFEPNEKGLPANLDEPICRLCHKKVPVSRSNTSNLRSHIRINHPATFATLAENVSEDRPSTAGKRQTEVSEAFAKGTKYQRESRRWQTLTDSVTRLLVEEMLPFNLVDKPAFKAMLQAFDKQYVLPDRKYFSTKAVPEKYSKMKDSVIRELKDVDHFSITTDLWSSVNMMPYMSFTIHYLNTNWELKSRCLETRFLPESHTSDNLAEALQSCLREWSLDEKKLACVTTDNGANIAAAVRKLHWGWLPCFGHNLHLAVTNSMKAEKDRTARAMGLCRTLVTTFSHSFQKKNRLQKEQTELDLPKHTLVLVS